MVLMNFIGYDLCLSLKLVVLIETKFHPITKSQHFCFLFLFFWMYAVLLKKKSPTAKKQNKEPQRNKQKTTAPPTKKAEFVFN